MAIALVTCSWLHAAVLRDLGFRVFACDLLTSCIPEEWLQGLVFRELCGHHKKRTNFFSLCRNCVLPLQLLFIPSITSITSVTIITILTISAGILYHKHTELHKLEGPV